MTLLRDLSLIRRAPLDEPTLTASEAAQKLGIKRSRILEWLPEGIIWAYMTPQRRYQISATYIETLLVQNGRRMLDHAYAELFALFWLVRHGTEDEAWTGWLRIVDLQACGTVVDSIQAGQILGARNHVLDYWRKWGYLRWVRFWNHGTAYYLASDIAAMLKEMQALTSYEAADRLNLSVYRVEELAATGKLASFRTPNGWQFDPDSVEALRVARAEPEAMMRAEAVRKRLGVGRHVVDSWVNCGVLARHSRSGTYWYPEAEVEAIYAELTTFGPWFEWLPVYVSMELPHNGRAWLNTARVARELGVRVGAVLRWRADELLPYCHRIPAALGRSEYDYPEAYVLGLAAYVRRSGGVLRMCRETLVAYRDACKGAGRIV